MGARRCFIPFTVKELGFMAFRGCNRLDIITIFAHTIGECAFYDCKGLRFVALENSIKKIEKWAFKGCDNLKVFIVPEDFETANKKVYTQLKKEYPTVKFVHKNNVTLK